MLQVFGFGRLGVLVGDLYFVDPEPRPGQEGAERGVRLELRVLVPGELRGSMYSARPIEAERPLWRVDLLETVDGPPGSLNRAHHHPAFDHWEPGHRVFDPALSAAPVDWVGDRLSDLPAVLRHAGVEASDDLAADAAAARAWVPEITRAVRLMLDGVKSGQLARPPASQDPASARLGWL
jgi:hypothetical protein